jgi:hypothetical protein
MSAGTAPGKGSTDWERLRYISPRGTTIWVAVPRGFDLPLHVSSSAGVFLLAGEHEKQLRAHSA